jgi:hypothetical protein
VLESLNRASRLGLAIVVVTVAGCGSAGTSNPTPVGSGAVPFRAAPPRLPAKLAPGTILIVDLTDIAAARPSTVEFASNGTLERMSWTGWGGSSVTGHGTASLRICQPNCAQGHDRSYPATVTLKTPKTCFHARFYTNSTVTVQMSGRPRKLASFIRNPC